jgi:hypothetical protein
VEVVLWDDYPQMLLALFGCPTSVEKTFLAIE